MKKSSNKQLISYDEVLQEELQNPAFNDAWEAEKIKRELISALIGKRIKNKLSQAEVAQKAGIKQPSLARVESGNYMPSLPLLLKLTRALDIKLEIKFS